MRGRVLVLDEKVPTPDQDSGSASTFSYLQILARAGFEVIFAPYTLNRPTALIAGLKRLGFSGPYTRTLRRCGIQTICAYEWTSADALVEAVALTCDVILLYRAPFAVRVFDVVRRA